ncbi:MAG: CoA-binding protein [Deltaproteobacteria bacterium]|nr:MAG: CoA-binding protein [Deltaproteobacteria bacterium]
MRLLTPEEIAAALERYRKIAIVGVSDKPERPSHDVARFLQERGYRIYPVNPRLEEVLGEKCYPSLLDLPEPVEIVDVFRRPEAIMPVAEAAIEIGARLFWMQLGIRNEAAARKLSEAGIDVVMDRCIKIERMKLDEARASKSPEGERGV